MTRMAPADLRKPAKGSEARAEQPAGTVERKGTLERRKQHVGKPAGVVVTRGVLAIALDWVVQRHDQLRDLETVGEMIEDRGKRPIAQEVGAVVYDE